MSKDSLNVWPERRKSVAYWWSVGFGAGLLRPAPGTWGSVLGVILGLAILQLDYPIWALSIGALLVTLISLWSIGAIESACGIHDAPEIVIDEIAGQWVAMIPLALMPFSWPAVTASFLLFRFFDILKPWPISWLDKHVGGGFGVMVDDLLAGAFAAICLYFGMAIVSLIG